MNKHNFDLFIKKLNHSIFKVILGSFLLCISPMVITTLCAYRIYEMNVINALGIGWIFLCILLALPLLIPAMLHLFSIHNTLKTGFDVYENVDSYIKSCRFRLKTRSIRLIIAGTLFLISSVLPIITVSILRTSDEIYVAYSYVAIFILAGLGISLLAGSLLRLWLISRIKYNILAGKEEEIEKEEQPKKKTKHRFLKTLVVTAIVIGLAVGVMSRGTWYIQPYIATIPSVGCRPLAIDYQEQTGIYTIHNDANTDFRILQLTDIHLGGSLFSYSQDIKALQTVYELIRNTKPDFVIVTGDFVFPLGIESYSFNNYTPMMQFASFMRNIGIPWAFTYGNHDTEFVASHSEQELNALFESFSYQTTGSLLYPKIQPKITGRSNQIILVENGDGTLNQALYLIDSNSYKSLKLNDYDTIHDDQVEWYASTLKQLKNDYGQDVSSLIFTHIPLKEYKTAFDLYKAGSDEVSYYFGTIGEANESICCSSYKSKLFETAVELGSTKGIFVGHDHYNTLSLEYQNIRLTYGMSIDYLAMPGISKRSEQRGGTLILLHPDSTFDIEQIPYTSIISD
ncbi:MAG: hypothetical protein E7256_11005 [Lachnospiraceae bacterium]|nr:hypothetical protein [Lachnospiraceae bacterium]